MRFPKANYEDLKVADQRGRKPLDLSPIYRLLGKAQPVGYEAEATINEIEPEGGWAMPEPPPRPRRVLSGRPRPPIR